MLKWISHEFRSDTCLSAFDWDLENDEVRITLTKRDVHIAHSLDMSTMTIVARASRNRGGLISMELNCLYRTTRDVVNSILQRTIPRIHSLERISARSSCSFLRASRLRWFYLIN